MKYFFIFVFSLLMMSPQVMAETSNYAVPKIPKKISTTPNLNNIAVVNRVKDLENQLDYLEKQNRLQEEQIKRLERSVDDIKRKR